ncbi:killer cell lectin-like receptor subfamily B member 1B allele A isoform X2 [Pleurodeles waltl]|uniref:killer cell lectin-like receptor subfamily B member 1B allele A isoform X2 n=1 Tax=Pleurodeles waltl TaxID=8319 RepID=UPI0037096E70
MAGGVVYADIRTPGGASRTEERRAAAGRCDSHCPSWHRRTLWISGGLHIIAVLAVAIFGVWVFRLNQKITGHECNLNNTSGAYRTPSCPLHWELQGRKCYYYPGASDQKNWSASHEACSSRGSRLAVIEDKAELDYLTSKLTNHAWIGLFVTPVGGHWTWVNGSTLKSHVFRVTGSAGGDQCGAVTTDSAIESSRCINGFYWICQREAEISSSRV